MLDYTFFLNLKAFYLEKLDTRVTVRYNTRLQHIMGFVSMMWFKPIGLRVWMPACHLLWSQVVSNILPLPAGPEEFRFELDSVPGPAQITGARASLSPSAPPVPHPARGRVVRLLLAQPYLSPPPAPPLGPSLNPQQR